MGRGSILANKKRVMVVDDDPDVLKTVGQILKANGYKVHLFDNGREFLRTLKHETKPTLIILDIMMPEMSGWEIYRRLEGNYDWKDIPVVFLTSRENETAVGMYNRYGIEYIKKPFDINDFKQSIKKAYNSRQFYIRKKRALRY